MERAGLRGRITLLLEDYRDLRGSFDKLVSIEMIEAVGDAYLGEFFRIASERLSRSGLLALQAITVPDQRYAVSLRSVDFVKRHVFPGGQCPSLQALLSAASRVSDLGLIDLEDITSHYAETLQRWSRAFAARRSQVAALTSPAFERLWRFYLAYCEGGFRERFNGTVQLLFAHADWRGGPAPGTLPARA